MADVDPPNLWNTFKDGLIQACDEVSGKKKGRRSHGDTLWWNEEVKEAIQQKKVAYKKMCKNRSEENKVKCNIKYRTKKVVTNFMRKEAEKELTKLNEKPNTIFTLVKFMKKDRKDIEVGRCMRGKDRRLDFSEKDRKNNMEEIMNKENDWDCVTAASIVEGPIKNATREGMAIAIIVIKPRKAAGPFKVCA